MKCVKSLKLSKIKRVKKTCTEKKVRIRFWGRGADAPFPQGLDALPTQRIPLCTISRHPFSADLT